MRYLAGTYSDTDREISRVLGILFMDESGVNMACPLTAVVGHPAQVAGGSAKGGLAATRLKPTRFRVRCGCTSPVGGNPALPKWL